MFHTNDSQFPTHIWQHRHHSKQHMLFDKLSHDYDPMQSIFYHESHFDEA